MENPYIKDSETLKQAWDESGVQKQLDQLLSDIQESNTAGESLANTDKTKSEVIDTPPSLSFEAIRSVSGDISMDNSHPVHSYNAESPMISRSKMLEATPQKYPGSTIIFTQRVKRLLDGYFARTHPWLLIVQKYKMLELIYTPSRNTQTEKGNKATLWAVLAYSSLQESRDTSTTVDHRESLPTPEQVYAKARQQIPNEETSLPGYAQAFLILNLFKLDKEDVAACWYLIGQAVRICLNLDTISAFEGRLDSEGGDDSHEWRLLLSCFVLDTIVSCQLRKPPHLRTEDAYFSSTLAETGPDEWESQAVSFVKSRNTSPTYQPSRAISIFNQYVGVIRILNDAMLDPMTSDYLCIKNLLALRHWQDHVPQHCVLSAPPGQDRLGPVSSSSLQVVNLHLAFKSTAIFLKMQQSLLSEKGLMSTQSVTVTSPSIDCLISSFERDFGVFSIPAIFKRYKVIGSRDTTYFADSGSSPDPKTTHSDDLREFQFSIMSNEPFPACLPTPAGTSEYANIETGSYGLYSAPAQTCRTEGGPTVFLFLLLLTE